MCFKSLQGIDPDLKVRSLVNVLQYYELKLVNCPLCINVKEMDVKTESCSDEDGSQEFQCRCKEGFDGERCEVSVCYSNYCNNNGLCSINENDIHQLQCECNYGFDGGRCEIDLCDEVTCENGFCDAGNCECDSGYVNIENICLETCAVNLCEELR